MTLRFTHAVTPEGLRIRLAEHKMLRTARSIPFSAWPDRLPRPVLRLLRGLIDAGAIAPDAEGVSMPHATVARAPAFLCDQLGLPSLGAFSLALQFDGRMETAEGRIRMRWSDANYNSFGAERVGAILRIGEKAGRLSQTLFELAEAADRFNATAGGEIDARISAWAPIQQALAASTGRDVSADAFMKSLVFYQAGAFALDVAETPDGPDFLPILMSRDKAASREDDAPTIEIGDNDTAANADLLDATVDALLPPELHRQFVERNFKAGGRTHDAYVLGRNTYVVLDPALKSALDVVRAKRNAPAEERRAFLRNPRAAIAQALGEDADALFIETRQYSDRVEGLGVWTKITTDPAKGATTWLPEKFGDEKAPVVTAENLADVSQAVERARAAGEELVVVNGEAVPVAELESQLARVRSELEPAEAPATQKEEKGPRIGLTIKSNIEGVEYEIARRPRRPSISTQFPIAQMSANAPKQHQLEGFSWLVNAWMEGWPGVLLADDMGLGKTYQALAFLAWIRANRDSGAGRHPTAPPHGPLLVVAPTALLRNWIEESRLHLIRDGLGEAVEAFGTGLKRLKRPKDAHWTEEDALDLDRLRKADWILTTYETLANFHRAFARVPYSVVVFDEMQKIKEPGSINARASKTINADFALGLTGTPIENKIEDLWAIFDRIAPGYLGALRPFSQTYSQCDPDRLRRLKSMLDQPGKDRLPAPMLRRMKDRARDGLPEKIVRTYRAPMPEPQADAYRRIVAQARAAVGSRMKMLEALQRFRGISLHPARADVDTSDAKAVDLWLGGSARVKRAVEVLREIEARGEKALVFIEDLAVQRAFAESIALVFDLPKIPEIVNGGVPGEARQTIVDRFQKAPPGFDLLMLSPKAAGVGLTLTAANHVLHLSRWWNPAVEDQCNDRAYRIGAKSDVTIHIPLAIHPDYGDDSFDVKLDALLDHKRALSRDMLRPPESPSDVDALYGGVMGVGG